MWAVIWAFLNLSTDHPYDTLDEGKKQGTDGVLKSTTFWSKTSVFWQWFADKILFIFIHFKCLCGICELTGKTGVNILHFSVTYL